MEGFFFPPSGRETTAVLTCLVADRSAPVVLELWGNAATRVLDLQRRIGGDGPQALLVEVSHFSIRAENGRKTLNPIRKMVSTDRTDVCSLAQGTQASVTAMSLVPPSETLFFGPCGAWTKRHRSWPTCRVCSVRSAVYRLLRVVRRDGTLRCTTRMETTCAAQP